jgi:DNA-binding NarL/FixJ family response regulator
LAASAEAALAALQGGLRPSSITLDMRLPGMSGMEFRRHLLADPRTADIPVMILTAYPLEPDEVAEMHAAGYLLKPYDIQAVTRKLEVLRDLTVREQEVLRCLLLGLSNKEIARRLEISVGTVKFHITHLLKKSGCESRADLIASFKDTRLKAR